MPLNFLLAFLLHQPKYPGGVPITKFAQFAGVTPVEADQALRRLAKRKASLLRVSRHPDIPRERVVTLTQWGHLRFGSHPCLMLEDGAANFEASANHANERTAPSHALIQTS
jgi:hypothetical protein